jgi:hypothetical protein
MCYDGKKQLKGKNKGGVVMEDTVLLFISGELAILFACIVMYIVRAIIYLTSIYRRLSAWSIFKYTFKGNSLVQTISEILIGLFIFNAIVVISIIIYGWIA